MGNNLYQTINQFLDHLRYEKQLSAHTLAAYQRDLLQTARQAESDQLSQCSQVTEKQLGQWLALWHQ